MNFLKILRAGRRSQFVNEKSFSITTFCADNRRKVAFSVGKSIEKSINDFLDAFLHPEADQWRSLRSQLSSTANRSNLANVDATIVKLCATQKRLETAKSFVEFLEKNPEIGGANITTLTNLLRTYHAISRDRTLTNVEELEIIEVYDSMKKKFPEFDANTTEGVISALSLTRRWRECLDLLNGISIYSPSLFSYTSIVNAAFRENEKEIALRMLRQTVNGSKIPKCEVFLAWINFCSRHGENLEEFLQFIALHEVQISEHVIKQMEKFLQMQGIPSQRASINSEGVCNSCNNLLKSVQITDEDFHELQCQFLDKVLIRKDVFVKSNPSELDNFRKFLSKTPPFDCVIDGLNALNLIDVVMHFSRKGQKVLVLGRKPSSNWSQEQMRILKSTAMIFLTHNLSQDDPFLLYAALASGKQCCIVSNDLMRNHAHLLESEKLQSTFRRWQHTHQFRMESSSKGEMVLKAPPMFSVTAHEMKGRWHVPFRDEYSLHQLNLFEIPQQWLCIDFSGSCSAPKRQ
ncbi:mitochondrial ribonuclease P catalytic subunit-like [Phlebotomus argentipes]|uniref:mitochondrial ribonuclease P catalytic subunit-like n=1 Tax=Phlebotomus argentipes TaxID=94469 RepID=UPI002892DEA7|nr:mitochondrial ribonuclease P catalytic subunit-like [Phlebotomus argentipes]